jgi:2'-5' RNA ligase
MKRTFIAIKIPLTNNIAEVYKHSKAVLKNEKIKWVEDWNLHITILFIGETEENDVEEICNVLSTNLKDINSFLLNIIGTGVFKNVYNPRALWFGIKESENLKKLHEIILNSLKSIGFDIQKRNFTPHLTIGRTKFIKDKNNFKKLIESLQEKEIERIKISDVYFYESILTSAGPRYEVIEKFILN